MCGSVIITLMDQVAMVSNGIVDTGYYGLCKFADDGKFIGYVKSRIGIKLVINGITLIVMGHC